MDVLSVAQSYQADQGASAAKIPSLRLMEAAGEAIANAIQLRWDKREVLILAGPGNNGGDGFVVARLLKAAKWPVKVYLLGEKAKLEGDAAANAKRWRSKVEPLQAALERLVDPADDVLVIDALFGAGLSKPLGGAAKTIAELLYIRREEGHAPTVVAVDMPSGVSGDTGQVSGGALKGVAFTADLTVTFCRPKPGHLLMPGRQLCGELLVADIGIPDSLVRDINPQAALNDVELWGGDFPRTDAQANKYKRGHLVVLGGSVMTGAGKSVV